MESPVETDAKGAGGKERVQVDVHIQNMSDHARGWVNKRIYMYMNEREREHMDGEMVPQTTSRCKDRQNQRGSDWIG